MFAKKHLGQNFLNNPEIRTCILEAAGDISGTNILEIGPGLGFLTAMLLQANANVTAVELDKNAVKILEKDFGHKNNFHLIQGDILEQDLDEIFSGRQSPSSETLLGGDKYGVIANIPYNITSPILRKLLADTQNKPEFAILMIQKEVARKLCDEKKNSVLKISVDVFAKVEILFDVSRKNFFPVPKVDSSVIKLTVYPEPLVDKEMQNHFFKVVRAGFSQKRKKLGNFIGKFFGMEAKELLGGIDPGRRAETLSIGEWEEVTKNYKNY